jgi:hypothetical protein
MNIIYRRIPELIHQAIKYSLHDLPQMVYETI